MNPSLPHPAADRFLRVASPIHTIVVLGWAFCFKILADHLSESVNPNRLRFYSLSIPLEWPVFAFVVAGVRLSGAAVLTIVGDRRRSARQVLRDFGVAAAFWVVALLLLAMFSRLASARWVATCSPSSRIAALK
jgi:hypothetical protein